MIHLDEETLVKWKNDLGLIYLLNKSPEDDLLKTINTILKDFRFNFGYGLTSKEFETKICKLIEDEGIKTSLEEIEGYYIKALEDYYKDREEVDISTISRSEALDETYADDLFTEAAFCLSDSFVHFKNFVGSYMKKDSFAIYSIADFNIYTVLEAENKYYKEFIASNLDKCYGSEEYRKGRGLDRYDHLADNEELLQEFGESLSECWCEDYFYNVLLVENKKSRSLEEDILYSVVSRMCSTESVLVDCNAAVTDSIEILGKKFYLLEVNPKRAGDFANAEAILLVISIFIIYLSGDLSPEIFDYKIAKEVFLNDEIQ